MSKQYVTRDQCEQTVSSIRSDLSILKIALVGEDLRGGIVADLAKAVSTISNIAVEQSRVKTEKTEKEELGSKWKLLIAGTLTGQTATIIIFIVKEILHL